MTDSALSAKSKINAKCPHGIWVSLLLNCWEQRHHPLLDDGKDVRSQLTTAPGLVYERGPPCTLLHAGDHCLLWDEFLVEKGKEILLSGYQFKIKGNM